MGYETYITGQLEVRPPLSEQELAELVARVNDWEKEPRIDWLAMDYAGLDSREIGGGTVIDLSTSGKHYGVDEGLSFFIAAMRDAGHTVTGEVFGDGEDSSDFWKLEIAEDGEVKAFEGKVVYVESTREAVGA